MIFRCCFAENKGVSGKKAFKFDWNDILKYSKFNTLKYINIDKLKETNFSKFNFFKREPADPLEASMSKSFTHAIS